MTHWTVDETLGRLVAEQPHLTRIFERLGLDFCCHADRTLAEACGQQGLDPGTVLRVLQAGDTGGRLSDDHGNWALATMSQLLDHVIAEHHGYLRAELPRIGALLKKVVATDGDRRPELRQVQGVFEALRTLAETHMGREEQAFFPMVRGIESGKEIPGQGWVAASIVTLREEHERLTAGVHRMQELTDNYAISGEACDLHRVLMEALRELGRDLHQHLHEEHGILFGKVGRAGGGES